MSTTNAMAKNRNRIMMVMVLAVIVAAVGSLFIEMKHFAAQRQAQHKHSFFEYIVTHHVGTLQEIDDGTGLNPQSYILTLSKAVPADQLQNLTYQLMHLYYEYDSGSTLTIMLPSSNAGHPIQVAQAHYDDDAGRLSMTLTPPNHSAQTINLSPGW